MRDLPADESGDGELSDIQSVGGDSRLSPDRQGSPDLQYAAKEACRDMSRPTLSSMNRLKRIARYLPEYTRVAWEFVASASGRKGCSTIEVYSGSGWAGCRESRRSTSGGVLVVGGGVVKTWSSMQATVAMSSGGAEY